jgi:hypothetical protein
MNPTSMPVQGGSEPAKLAAVLATGMLLAASTGSAVSAQDAYGGITGPNYSNPYPQSGAYFSRDGSAMTSGSPRSRWVRSRRATAH